MYPDFEKKYGFFKTVRAGLEGWTHLKRRIDALISINTPLLLSRLQLDALILICLTSCLQVSLHARTPRYINRGDLEIINLRMVNPMDLESVKVLDMLNMLRRLSMIEIFRVVYKFD